MRTYQTQEVTENMDVLVTQTCDLCGISADGLPQYYDPAGFTKNGFDTNITISNPNELWLFIDMCSDCFTTKLMPWLQSQGSKVKFPDNWSSTTDQMEEVT